MEHTITYVGLDVHKDTIAVAAAERGNRDDIRRYGTIASTPAALRSVAVKLGHNGAALRFCYEAGACGYGAQRLLTAAGHECLVVAPSLIPLLREVIGLYIDPPAHAVVLSVNEKSQIQALDRTQPGLPLKRGRCGTMTHDYKRDGTTTLFAALDVAAGRVIGRCMQRHRSTAGRPHGPRNFPSEVLPSAIICQSI